MTRGSTIGTGLFTIYYKHDDILLSLSPSQFDRDYLLVTQVAQGIGELGLDGGTTLRSDLVRFHREGDRVELWVVNPHMAAAPGTPMARTVSYSFGHSVAQSFPIASERREGQVLIDITPFFLSDWADVETALQNAAAQRKVNATISLDDKRSSFQQLRLYPTNVEAEVRLTFESSRNLGLETVSDYRWIPLGIHYSLIELPAAPMRPRYADDRVGYFVSAIKDFSRDTADDFFVRYINRWRLEKKYPSAAMSVPVQPITYYIDRTVPEEWRSFVRAGILEWNRAFEEAGISRRHSGARCPDRQLMECGGRTLLDRTLDGDQSRGLRAGPHQRRSANRRDPQRRRDHFGRLDSAVARAVGAIRLPPRVGGSGLPGRLDRDAAGQRPPAVPVR